jgi:hypothetical protein
VTEAAIIALTARSDADLLPGLRAAEKRVTDIVIRDDLENAIDVIEARAKYLATPQGKSAGGSVEQAVRTYFHPALEPSPAVAEPAGQTLRGSVPHHSPAQTPAKGAKAANGGAPSPAQSKPGASVEIQNLTFSPDKTRALAHVVFQDPMALANYDMVLKKESGDWVIASVWLGNEVEKTPPGPNPKSPPEN